MSSFSHFSTFFGLALSARSDPLASSEMGQNRLRELSVLNRRRRFRGVKDDRNSAGHSLLYHVVLRNHRHSGPAQRPLDVRGRNLEALPRDPVQNHPKHRDLEAVGGPEGLERPRDRRYPRLTYNQKFVACFHCRKDLKAETRGRVEYYYIVFFCELIQDAAEVRRRFPENPAERKNVFVMRPDPHLAQTSKDGAAPLAQIYVDLWQLGGDPADRFLLELETKLRAKPIEALKVLARKSS